MIGGRAQSARMRRPRAVRAASKGEKPTVSTVTDEDDPSDGDGARIVPPFSREQFEGLKRKDLQALCKVHNIKSSGKV